MKHSIVLIFSILILFSSCFAGIDKQGSVTSYSNGVIYTLGGQFRVGKLSSDWKKHEIKYRAAFFVNKKDHATITIDSWCQRAVDDRSLETLTQQLLKGITDLQTLKSETITLDNRAALLTDAQGLMDGQPVFVSLAVLKKNYCVFDFFYVSEPAQTQSLQDFQNLVQGFQWKDGPGLL